MSCILDVMQIDRLARRDSCTAWDKSATSFQLEEHLHDLSSVSISTQTRTFSHCLFALLTDSYPEDQERRVDMSVLGALITEACSREHLDCIELLLQRSHRPRRTVRISRVPSNFGGRRVFETSHY